MNNKTESEAKGVELTKKEEQKIFKIIGDLTDFIPAGRRDILKDIDVLQIYIETIFTDRLASQKAAFKEAVIKAIQPSMDKLDSASYACSCGKMDTDDAKRTCDLILLAVAEFTKSVEKAFKEAGK
jgi:hypothetical protein